jgi:hypothetical protein
LLSSYQLFARRTWPLPDTSTRTRASFIHYIKIKTPCNNVFPVTNKAASEAAAASATAILSAPSQVVSSLLPTIPAARYLMRTTIVIRASEVFLSAQYAPPVLQFSAFADLFYSPKNNTPMHPLSRAERRAVRGGATFTCRVQCRLINGTIVNLPNTCTSASSAYNACVQNYGDDNVVCARCSGTNCSNAWLC